MSRAPSREVWWLAAANAVLVALVIWLGWRNAPPAPPPGGRFRVDVVPFSDLPGWQSSDPRAALAAFARSCAVLAKLPPARAMGGVGYAGAVRDWLPTCRAAPRPGGSADSVRRYFETAFVPLAITDGKPLFTGYYEPELSARWNRDAAYRFPVYGKPADLVTVDLGAFRPALAGRRIAGRVENAELVPYPARADIEANGLAEAPILLYTDDPVNLFFLHIQGSGRARFPDGGVLRLSFAGTNGRSYTAIGRVLIQMGAIARENISMQSIRAWLLAHPDQAGPVMDNDQSYVFFAVTPLGDPALGSPGTEGVPLTAQASLAVDPRVHPLGVPVFVATERPDANPAKPDIAFDRLLIAQDTGGAIRGAVRGDVFFGSDAAAAAIAGRMKSPGAMYVLVPKSVAAALGGSRRYDMSRS